MSKRIDDIKTDLRDIKSVLVENTFKMGEYNAQLEIHIKGVKDLNERVRPIEEHVTFLRKLSKAIAWSVGVGTGIASVVKLLF